jgi:hypothetical protein
LGAIRRVPFFWSVQGNAAEWGNATGLEESALKSSSGGVLLSLPIRDEKLLRIFQELFQRLRRGTPQGIGSVGIVIRREELILADRLGAERGCDLKTRGLARRQDPHDHPAPARGPLDLDAPGKLKVPKGTIRRKAARPNPTCDLHRAVNLSTIRPLGHNRCRDIPQRRSGGEGEIAPGYP